MIKASGAVIHLRADVNRTSERAGPGDHWRTVSADETEVPDFRTYTHLYMGLPYMGTPTNLPTTFDPLLRKVADFETAGVILAPRKLG
ncbi:hypothetical protein [Streptomyces sp. NBC_01238]|uniref:hypothetical protein n=1 Tax=Streptomyces sp. NBC_01238 TaxID=2903791 RepID=UPI00386A8A86